MSYESHESGNQIDIEKIREEIIKTNRLILINNLFPNRLLLPLGNSSEELIIDDSPCIYPFSGASQVSQASGFLFSFLFEKPQVLVDIFLMSMKRPNIASLAFNLIPTIFSFFASQENLEMAENFYMSILSQRKTDVKHLFPLIIPFFRCGAVYRFIESSSSIFFQRFMIDISDQKRKFFNFLIPIHAGFLIDCFTAALCLLPIQHIKIMRELMKISTKHEFLDFILDEFFSPLTLAWLRAEALPSDTPFFEKIVIEMRNRDYEIQGLFEAIKTTKTVFQLPRFFNRESDPFILLTKVSDLITLTKLMNDLKLLPEYINIKEFSSINPEFHNELLWCQSFNLKRSIKSIRPEPLIFKEMQMYELPEIQEAAAIKKRITTLIFNGQKQGENPFIYAYNNIKMQDAEMEDFVLKCLVNELLKHTENFERFLEEHVFLAELRKWCNTLNEFIQTFVSRRLEFLFFSKKMTQEYFISLKSVYNKKLHMKLFFLHSLESYIPKIYELYGARIEELQNNWNTTTKDVVANNEMPAFATFIKSLRPVMADAVWNTIKILRCTWKLSYQHRFIHIIRALRVIDPVVEQTDYGEKAITVTLQQINSNVIIPSFIIINALCMHSSIFPYFIDEEEKRLWISFETSLLSAISSEKIIYDLIGLQLEIHDTLLFKLEKIYKAK